MLDAERMKHYFSVQLYAEIYLDEKTTDYLDQCAIF